MKYSHFGWTSHCVNISYDPIKLSADGKITTSKPKAFINTCGHLQSSSMFLIIWKQNKEKRLQILLFFFSHLAVKAVKSLTNFSIGVFEVCLSVCQEELASVSGLWLSSQHRKAAEPAVASAIISSGNQNTVHTTRECKNKGAIQSTNTQGVSMRTGILSADT